MAREDFASLIKPSEEINSVYIISAPNSLQINLNEASVTFSIGARKRGLSPRSKSAIFMLQKYKFEYE
ncbi:hypothetical protein BRDCF_p228 [Bacteroidales bacterium CF]|nr:hypothetical protein BRDCF_p228 [Bacteroidales bacterium CF]